jgi:hypothetical protein
MQLWVAIGSQSDDTDPGHTQLDGVRRVQAEDFDQASGIRVFCAEPPSSETCTFALVIMISGSGISSSPFARLQLVHA